MQRRQRVLRTWILVMLPLLLATGELRAGQLAVLSRDIEIEGVSESSMPRVHAGDIVVCPAILRDGYLVILRDATGELRGALMPFHDEWGHATARTWAHDKTLEDHMLQIRRPTTLKPYGIVLKKGDKYPLLARAAHTVQIEYRCAAEVALLTVPRDAVTIEQTASMSVDDRLEADLTQRLELQQEERTRLQSSINATEEYLTRVSQLLLDLNEAQLETAALEGQTIVNENLKETLVRLSPRVTQATRDDLEALKQSIARQTPHRGQELNGRLAKEMLTNTQTEQNRASVELERWKAAAERSSAEYAVVANPDMRQQSEELRKAISSVRKAAKLQTQMSGQLSTKEMQQEPVAIAVDLLMDLLEKNRELLAELKEVEIEQAQRRNDVKMMGQELRGVNQMLNPPPPSPPTPVATPAGATTPADKMPPTAKVSPTATTKPAAKVTPRVEEKGQPTAVERIWAGDSK
jgi:hypothetical protein